MPQPFEKPKLASARPPAPPANSGASVGGNGREPLSLDKLYRTEAPKLTAYFERRLRERQDAPDYVQEAFARLARFMRIDRLQQPAAYLQRIATNLIAEQSRRARAKPSDSIPIEEASVGLAPEQGYRLEADELLCAYRSALEALPEKTRIIFLMHRAEDLPYRVIGERLGLSIPTIQYHVARALAAIDAALRG
jgi:RNA polymerase sigma factor (sigma-70 family)